MTLQITNYSDFTATLLGTLLILFIDKEREELSYTLKVTKLVIGGIRMRLHVHYLMPLPMKLKLLFVQLSNIPGI